MRKCTGNNTYEWGPDEIFDVTRKNCGNLVEFFEAEITIFKNYNHMFLKDPNGDISGHAELLKHTNQLPEHVMSTITEWARKPSVA